MEKIENRDEVQRIYRARFGGQADYRAGVWRVLVRNYFQQWVEPGATVLDLGAGYGQFISTIQSAKKYAMDLNPDTPKKVGTDVEVISQDCAEPWPLLDNSLDVIFTSNFLEHLPDKQAVGRTLDEAKRCLKPGGKIIALGPNIKYVPGAYWDFWDHHVPLTEHSLSEALQYRGFQIERCVDKFLPYTMAAGPRYPLFFIAAYLQFPFVWRILGKQFLVIGKKGGV